MYLAFTVFQTGWVKHFASHNYDQKVHDVISAKSHKKGIETLMKNSGFLNCMSQCGKLQNFNRNIFCQKFLEINFFICT